MESKYAGMSPYNYSFNNPVMWNDLSGADPGNPPKEGDMRSSNGQTQIFFDKEWMSYENLEGAEVKDTRLAPIAVDNDLYQYNNRFILSPEFSNKDSASFNIDFSSLQATIENNPYTDEYKTFQSNQAWLQREMTARRGLDPIGYDLASSPGVQFGMDLVLPSYGITMSGMQIYSGIKNDNTLEVVMGSVGLGLSAFGAYRNFTTNQRLIKDAKVELMGGPSPKLEPNVTNFDLEANVGIKDDVANFSKYFSEGSIDAIQVNNPRALFLNEIHSSLRPGGIVTVRGTYNNSYFKKIWDGKAIGLEGYNVIKSADGVPNLGYLTTKGDPIQGSIKEIILQKR